MNRLAIFLAEAVKLKSILLKKQRDLQSERHRVAFKTVEKGEQPVREGRTMQDVEHELQLVRDDIRLLDKLVYVANTENTVSFFGEELMLVEAIELAKQMRVEAETLRDFSMRDKEELQHGFGETPMYEVALYDPHEYYVRAEEMEKRAHKLSNAINAKNFQVTVDFDDSRYI